MPHEDNPLYGENLSRRSYLNWFWDSYDDASSYSSEWRETAEDLYLLYASRSWKESDRRWLERTHRVPVEANLMLSTVEAIVGSDLLARQEVQFQPGEAEDIVDQVKGDMLTHVTRVLKEKCQGYSLDSRALFDMLVTGEGWAASFLDSAADPMLPRYEVPSPLEMYRDPDAVEDNLRDAQFVIRRRRFTVEHAQAMWPGKKDLIEEIAEVDYRGGRTLGAVAATALKTAFGSAGGSGDGRREVEIYEHQYWRMVPMVHFTDPASGQDRKLPEKEFDRWLASAGARPETVYTQPSRRYFRSFVAATRRGRGEEEILSQKPLGKLETLLTHGLTGYRKVTDAGRRVTYFGIVEVGADGQRLINRTISAVLDYLARVTKGGADVEEGALPEGMTLAQYAQQRATTGGYALVSQGANTEGRIKHHPAPTWPSGFEKLFEMLVGIHDSSTVGAHFRGQLTQAGDSSKAFDAGVIQTQVVLARLMDNLHTWREAVGKTQASLALSEMPRVDLEPFLNTFRVEGATYLVEQDPVDGEPFETPLVDHPVDLLLGEDPFDWSVIVDTGSASPSAKQKAFELFLHGLISTFTEAGMPPQALLDPLLDASPFPRTVVEKMRRKMREVESQAVNIQTVEQAFEVLSQMDDESRYMVISSLVQRFNLPLVEAAPAEPPAPAPAPPAN